MLVIRIIKGVEMIEKTDELENINKTLGGILGLQTLKIRFTDQELKELFEDYERIVNDVQKALEDLYPETRGTDEYANKLKVKKQLDEEFATFNKTYPLVEKVYRANGGVVK